jgi:hypothetical protein
MTQSKKYSYQVTQDNTSWTTEIIRRASSKTSVVTKSQSGFSTEALAQEWGQNEVKTLLQNLNLNEQKKRRAKKDKE